MSDAPKTRLCSYRADAVFYRGANLVEELIGRASFVDVFYRQTFGEPITEARRRIVDAVLVALMEHGMTPSATAARLVYSSSPENIQSGVAAGLLAVGSRFVGTMEDCAMLLRGIVEAPDAEAAARAVAIDHYQDRRPVPGFGHHLHKPDDPRATALLAIARETETAGPFQEALAMLARQVDAASGRHVTINATGAVAALLGDIGVPVKLMRAFAVLSRTAGLIAHIAEEQERPTDRYIWKTLDEAMLVPLAETR